MTDRKKTKYPGIYQHNGRYVIIATLRTGPTGSRRRAERTLPEGTTLTEAKRSRVELQRELEEEPKRHEKSEESSATSLPTTVADYAERWFAVKASRLKESVKHHYLAVLSMRILPYLGERAVREITRRDIEEWVGRMERAERAVGRPYSKHTCHAWFRVLLTMMRDAAADLGFPDPCVRVRAPSTKVESVREQRTLTAGELGRLLETARAYFPEWHAEIATVALTGMRPGEAYALTWSDLRFDDRVILVRRACWRGHVSTTKTGASRVSAMPSQLSGILKEHLSSREALGEAVGPDDLVFPSTEGTARASSALFKTLGIVGKIANIPQRLGPQVLRRTMNTLLVEAGVSAVVVRAQLGHATSSMTFRYAGVHESAKLEAVENLVATATEAARSATG